MATCGAGTSKYIKNADGHYVCPHCDKVTEKQNTMYYHIKKSHLDDLPFECKKCEDHPRFLQKSLYLKHLAAVHPTEAVPEGMEANPYVGVAYACPGCAHSASTKANLLIHYARAHCAAWIPSWSRTTACVGCAKVFNSSSAYLYHCATCAACTAHASPDQASMLSRIK